MNIETPLQRSQRRNFPAADLSQIFSNPAPSPYTPFSNHRPSSTAKATTRQQLFSAHTFVEAPEPSEEIDRYLNGDLDTALRGAAVDMLVAGRKRNQLSDGLVDGLAIVSQVIDTLEVQLEVSRELSRTHTIRPETRQRMKNVNTWLRLEHSTWRLMKNAWRDIEIQSLDLCTRRLALNGVDALQIRDQVGYVKLERIVEWLETIADESLNQNGGPQLKPLDDPAYRWAYTASALDGEPVSIDYPFQNDGSLDEVEQKAELRLSREIFRLVRAGRIDEAEDICRQLGQPWRAALIAGGKRACAMASNGKKGEARRIWRKAASSIAKSTSKEFTSYERAICGVFAGVVDPVLAVTKSYDDQVWARTSVLLDHLAEKGLASTDSDAELKDEQILQAFEDSINSTEGNDGLDEELSKAFRKVQSYIALGPQISEGHLLTFVESLQDLSSCAFRQRSEWICRFSAQVCIFLKFSGLINGDDSKILEAFDDTVQKYIRLVLEKDLDAENQATTESTILAARPLVARLTAQFLSELSNQKKIVDTFSEYLYSTLRADLEHEKIQVEQEGEQVGEVEERRVVALKEASECLSEQLLQQVTVHVIDMIWNSNIPSHHVDEDGNITTEEEAVLDEIVGEDELVVRSIEFLLYPTVSNYDEAILRATRAARRFFIAGKRAATKRLIQWFPHEVLSQVRPDYCGGALHEFDCWRAYLDALVAHSKWNAFFSSRKPTAPSKELLALAAAPASDVDHNDKAAATRHLEEYRHELEEFNRICKTYSDEAISSLRSALLFSGGWMHEFSNSGEEKEMSDGNESDSTRNEEITAVQRFGIPQMAMLLHHVLQESQMYEEAVKLASLIADEGLCLYQSFRSSELKSFLAQIAESAILLADEKCSADRLTSPYRNSFFESRTD